MRITWYGHAAFLIETDGTRIIMDPYSTACGYDAIDEPADVVALSHENQKYHSCLDDIQGEPKIIRGLEILQQPHSTHGIEFSACEVYEDDNGTGPNAMVSFKAEGLRVSHLGDLGHALNKAQTDFLMGTDILLALAGGPPTLRLEDLMALVDRLQPPLVIPMHMGNNKVDLDLHPVEDLIALFPSEKVVRHQEPTLEVTADSLPVPSGLAVLPHTR